ncbi:MAG: YecR family lipoprotein [Methyloglobulus sp.]|nr:hypothetical protein [Methyloglobulus sp.]
MKIIITQILIYLLILVGCASPNKPLKPVVVFVSIDQNPGASDQEKGIVGTYYNYNEFQNPQLDIEQIKKIVDPRCKSWGFSPPDYKNITPHVNCYYHKVSGYGEVNCGIYNGFIKFQCTVPSNDKINEEKEVSSKNNIYSKIFNKKWSVGEYSCNKGGGTYKIYSKESPFGVEYITNGKSSTTDTPQRKEVSFEIVRKNKIRKKLKLYAEGNQGMVALGVDPNTLVMDLIVEIELINPKKTSTVEIKKMINLETLTKNGNIEYENTKTKSISYLCK